MLESKNNIKQLAVMCVAYEVDFGAYPPDLDTLIKEMMMSPRILSSPVNPNNPNSYLYVRADIQAPASMQPVIIEDPANYGGEETIVAFADSHVETIRGRDKAAAWWAKAQELVTKHGTEGAATWEEWKDTVQPEW